MAISYVEYDLQSSFIMNWLVAGPQEIPTEIEILKVDQETKKRIAEKYFTAQQEISAPPVERGPLHEGVLAIGDYRGDWNYYRCKEDHLVDMSCSLRAGSFVRAWAYTQLLWAETVDAVFTVTAECPVDIWVNKKLALHYSEFPSQKATIQFHARLKKGMNKILLRMANIASPFAVLAAGLKVEPNQGGGVRIPTLIPSISRRNQLEAVYEKIYMEREIHAPGELITLVYPENIGEPTNTDARLQTISGRIYGQAFNIGKPGDMIKLGSPAALPNTNFNVYVTPRDWELYESNIRITKRFEVWSLGRQRFSTNPNGDYNTRRKEALTYAATVEDALYAEIAKIALGDWGKLGHEILKKSIDNIRQCKEESDVELMGLLGVLARYGDQAELPEWVKIETTDLALNYNYSIDLPLSQEKYLPEDDFMIISYTCAILAGQLFSNDVFRIMNKTGKQLRQDGEKAALTWMIKRGNYGFVAWDSKELYSKILSALSYLIDLAQAEEVWELASVLMDKILFTIALNSYKGVYGSTQGYGTTLDIKSGLLEPTSGITRLMWGMGVFNRSIAGTVSLACLSNYELPQIIAEIATGSLETLVNKEQQALMDVPVNKITYRTPDYMISSAQSYRPGEPGKREHIWQATLGPKCIIFVNHPGCATENEAHTPNYWLGNGTLPRVAQHENMLVGIYNIPDDSTMDFTHAYFPVKEFDEFIINDCTAFARKGEGYIALTAVNGLEQVTFGRTAYRELRSHGKQNAWLCQMGRRAVDGSFSDFQEQVKRQNLTFDSLKLLVNTKKGDILLFGWDDPLLYNNKKLEISGFSHYENPYTITNLPCEQMEINTGEYLLRLRFGEK